MRLWAEETINTDGSEKVKSKDGQGLEGTNLVMAGSDEHRQLCAFVKNSGIFAMDETGNTKSILL